MTVLCRESSSSKLGNNWGNDVHVAWGDWLRFDRTVEKYDERTERPEPD